jgi:tripartite-type tricarboxylate transporter receptor subunit TctC
VLRLRADIDVVHVPYKGAAQIVTDLVASHVQMVFEKIQILLPHIEAGRIRALAVADSRRSDRLCSVSTTVESGFPDIQRRTGAAFWRQQARHTAWS